MEIVKSKNLEILELRKKRIVEFLRKNKMIVGDKTEFVITFNDGRKVSLNKLFMEFCEEVENYPFFDMLMKVQQFHDTFSVKTRDMVGFPTEHEQRLRFNLINEEANETLDASKDSTDIEALIEAMDGIGDQLYIVLGTFLVYGMRKEAVETFLAIHDSNMTKLGADGKPIYREEDGKVIKGPNFQKPTERIRGILSEAIKQL